MLFTLVFIFTLEVGGRAAAIGTVPGFLDAQECLRAEAQLEKYDIADRGTCVEVK